MRALCAVAALMALSLLPTAAQQQGATFGLAGLPDSRVDAAGRLVEDWGSVGVTLDGAAVQPAGKKMVTATRLAGKVPAAEVRQQCGQVTLTLTAFRGPAWPSGFDVLTVRMEERIGKPASFTLRVDLPEGAQISQRAVTVGGGTVMLLTETPTLNRQTRPWGYADDAVSMPGWATPEGDCDPAYRNIRAGLGGVPIAYRFAVEPNAAADVVLGLCESFWSQPGQRAIICQVEGAAKQAVDPIARWGRHKPGALLFHARDANGDGWLDVGVTSDPTSPDQNPILNVIWLFPPGQTPPLEEVTSGRASQKATRYVDCGGSEDQSLYGYGKLEYNVELPAGGLRELSFFVASPGGSLPAPGRHAWTAEKLLAAAGDVWRASR